MGEDDERGKTAETDDPVETVRSTDHDSGSGSCGRFGRSSEGWGSGSERSVRGSSDKCGIFLLVEIGRVGSTVTFFAGSYFCDRHVATHLTSLVVRVAPVVVKSYSRRVIGHSVRRDVIGSDSRSSS
jgi:hypothetical protein